MSMQILFENWRSYLTELIVYGEQEIDPNEDYYLIVVGSNAYVAKDEGDMKIKESEIVGFYELLDEFEDQENILFGHISNHVLYLDNKNPSLSFDPKSSVLIKKVVKQFEIEEVERATIEDFETTRKHSIVGKIPDIGYHGTSTNYLKNILKFGLKPNESATNYDDIYHEELVFLSTRFEEAWHHATHTMMKIGGDPVLISFKIPNKDLLIPDYDIDVVSKDSYYDNIDSYTREKAKKHRKQLKGKSFSLSKEFGIYGYKGRIPSSFFEKFFLIPNVEETGDIDSILSLSPKDAGMVSVGKKEIIIYLETKEEFGYGEFEDEENHSVDEISSMGGGSVSGAVGRVEKTKVRKKHDNK